MQIKSYSWWEEYIENSLELENNEFLKFYSIKWINLFWITKTRWKTTRIENVSMENGKK